MNKAEREYLIELNEMMTTVPFPISTGGTQSSSVTGFVAYSEDMRQLLPFLKMVMEGIIALDNVRRYQEWKEDDIAWGWDYHHPKQVLKAIKKWLGIRSSEEWGKSSTRLDKIYEKIIASEL